MPVGIAWIAKEDLLTGRQFGVWGRLDAPGRPGYVRDAVFVEEGPAFVLRPPGGGAVGQGLGEEDGRAGGSLGDDDAGRVLGGFVDLLWQLVVALVAAGNAAEAAFTRAGVGEAPGDDNEAVVDLVVAEGDEFAMVCSCGRGGRTVVGVETSAGHSFFHEHAVDSVEAEAVAETKTQDWHDCFVVKQIDEGLAPFEEAGSVGGAAEALGLAWGGELLDVQQAVERLDFRRGEGVFDYQVALDVEKILQQVEIAHFLPFCIQLNFGIGCGYLVELNDTYPKTCRGQAQLHWEGEAGPCWGGKWIC